MNILVLGGGTSSERDVSMKSAAAVREALTGLGHHVTYLDPTEGLQVVVMAARAHDLVFPALHGAGGEDGTLQRALDEIGVPYVGAGAQASELCFDKVRLKRLIAEHGIDTPRSEVVTAETFGRSPLIQAPFVLKTVDGGSSLGIMIVHQLPYDETRARELLAQHGQMLLEELAVGTEITVPILGETATPAVEIVPPAGHDFDYEYKYNGQTTKLCPPQHLTPEQHQAARALGEQIFRLAGVRHLARVDMIVTPSGRLCVLEVNTLPGMTATSLFPTGAAAAGYSFPELMTRLIELATHPA